jgi:hypothetical protein
VEDDWTRRRKLARKRRKLATEIVTLRKSGVDPSAKQLRTLRKLKKSEALQRWSGVTDNAKDGKAVGP